MNNYKALNVFLNGHMVGTLAITADHLVAFEYTQEWIDTGFSISPFSLPLQKGVFLPKGYDPFEGLFGVFSDSLPDGWGRLLVDRLLAGRNVNPLQIDSLNRLAIVGSTGMGALTYMPEISIDTGVRHLTLDQLARECRNMFQSEQSEDIDTLFQMAGSSGGARPKIFYQMGGEEWIVKFPSSMDRPDIGRQEYAYSLCAKSCGIDMPETRLLPSSLCEGYFAVKRFDREQKSRIHMVSAGGLLETSHRIPNLDYQLLMRLTIRLTQDYEQLERLYRLMCFNVFAHNRDDHSKNFSYLCRDGVWRLSPAYDLTYSNSIGGEHATTVNGNGTNPGMKDLLAVAERAKLDSVWARETAEEIQGKVNKQLSEFLRRR